MAETLDRDSYAPDDEERSLAKYVEELYLLAKQHKDPVAEKVKVFEKMWNGDHWPDHVDKRRTRATTNFTFSIVETEVTWLTENRPNIIVLPMTAEDADAARVVERILLDDLWRELNIRRKTKRMVRSGLIRGKGFLKVTWDETYRADLGGEVAVDYVPWHEVFLDPAATSMEECRFVIHSRVLPLSEIVRRWPKTGWKVQPDPRYSDISDSDMFSADVDRPVISSLDGQGPLDSSRYRAQVIECWLRDDSYELREEVGADGEPTGEYSAHLLYPNGRLIIVANGVVLTDSPNPYADGEFPFVDFSGYERDDSIWDMGEIEQLLPIQRVINILESRLIDNARLMTNTVWVVDKNSGVKSSDLTNREGQVISKNPRSEVRREAPPPLPEHYFTLYLQLQRNMETITGIHDVTQGRRPRGITAATAISLLQEAGQARIRDKARNLEDSLRRLGRLMVSRIVQFYPPGRLVRFEGENNTTEFVRFDPSSVRVGLDLQVEAGSSLQMNEQQRFQMAIELFQAGAIDAIGLLEATNFPGRHEIIARIQREQALMSQQQAAPDPAMQSLGAGPDGPLPPIPLPINALPGR